MTTFETILKIFSTVTPDIDTATITMDSRLEQDLGITSLSMLLLALAIEKEYGFRFDTVEPFKTVREVAEYIDNKMQK